MTSSPPNIQAARTLLLAHLDFHPNQTKFSGDLDPAEVGIVGDPNHRGGYHCGSDRVVSNDYSVHESPRDKNGLTGYASALDVGQFTYGSHNLRTFSAWLVGECRANASDTRDIREVIYSLDGSRVLRWDRLGRRTTGDSSHRSHTHISFFRDATKAGRDLTAVFRRYLTTIGLVAGEEDELSKLASDIIEAWAVGVDHTPDGHLVAPTVFRTRDEAWQASVDERLTALAAAQAAPIDYDKLADAIVRRAIKGEAA